MATIPEDWALYQTYLTGELVYEIFLSKIHQRPVKYKDIGLLDIDTSIAVDHLANVMAAAYSNPGMHSGIRLLSFRSVNLPTVRLKIDMVRYNESLDKYESGRSEKREQTLLDKFPPEEQLFLTTPSVIVDSGCRIIIWYLPGAMTGTIMVSLLFISVSNFISSGSIYRQTYIAPQIP